MVRQSEMEAARLILVSGHKFGAHAFEGIFSSDAFLNGHIVVPLMIGLHEAHAQKTVGYQSLRYLASEQGIEYISTMDGRLSSLAGPIRSSQPRYILVIGWSHLISKEILSTPGTIAGAPGAMFTQPGQFGCIGMHPTSLPQGRGQAPIPWTIIKRFKETALTVFFLEAGADTGPVIAKYDLEVRGRETAASLFYRIAHAHFTAGLDLAEHLANRQVQSLVQDESTATRWPRRRPGDGEILNTMTSLEIDSLVRALLGPYPRAFTFVNGRRLAVHAVESPASSIGQMYDHTAMVSKDRVRFRCQDRVVDLVTSQL